jgi:hypothetical protein
MPEIETDYLVVGAGASGMAFVDTLLSQTDDVEVVIADRRYRPGGHWVDAYPFVRLHQPSANYGVASRTLGCDRIDESGPNAGFYERATSAEICEYFGRVLDDWVASGRLRFLAMHDYIAEANGDGQHHLRSLLSDTETTVRVRRKFVDATYIESEIPSRHTPKYDVDDGVRFVPPNELVHLEQPAAGYTVIGAGKTAMDTCTWLMDAGVAPDAIRWVKPREGWQFDRRFFQPLEMVGAYMQLQARWVEALADADDAMDFAHRMEASGVFLRIDRDVEATMFRGATISQGEVDALREIENVVRDGYVRRIGTQTLALDGGDRPSDSRQVYVDCTAAGVRAPELRPVFEGDRITLQLVTIGIIPWSTANIAMVEATRRDADDSEKNALTPPVVFTGRTADLFDLAYRGMTGLARRSAEPDLAAWNEQCRLNPSAAFTSHLDDPQVMDAMTSMGNHLGAALARLERAAVGSS